MTDKNSTTDFRPAGAKIRGLGASRHGVEHWWAQRVTAVANVLLGVCFIVIVGTAAGQPWPVAAAIISGPVTATLLGLFVISVTYHMRLGLQIVIEDYVHDEGVKLAANLANTFFTILIAGLCLFALVKISFFRALLPA